MSGRAAARYGLAQRCGDAAELVVTSEEFIEGRRELRVAGQQRLPIRCCAGLDCPKVFEDDLLQIIVPAGNAARLAVHGASSFKNIRSF
jgi:hypothetical protein